MRPCRRRDQAGRANAPASIGGASRYTRIRSWREKISPTRLPPIQWALTLYALSSTWDCRNSKSGYTKENGNGSGSGDGEESDSWYFSLPLPFPLPFLRFRGRQIPRMPSKTVVKFTELRPAPKIASTFIPEVARDPHDFNDRPLRLRRPGAVRGCFRSCVPRF